MRLNWERKGNRGVGEGKVTGGEGREEKEKGEMELAEEEGRGRGM